MDTDGLTAEAEDCFNCLLAVAETDAEVEADMGAGTDFFTGRDARSDLPMDLVLGAFGRLINSVTTVHTSAFQNDTNNI